MKASKVLRASCAFSIGFTEASARPAQFYTQSEEYGVALEHRSSGNSSDIYMHLEAPSSYQWAAVGTGDKMAGSFMLVMRVTGAGDRTRKVAYEARLTVADVDLSTRTASGHGTPEEISLHVEVLGSQVSGGRMQAQVRWDLANANGLAIVDFQSTKQAWIWAVGPRVHSVGSSDRKRDSQEAGRGGFEQHSSYGVFFTDMTKAKQTSNNPPELIGTSNISTAVQGGSYHALVVLHALLLGVAFVVVFPLGVVALRFRWKISFGAHWLTQAIASSASFVGLILAVALSVISVKYNGFSEAHQVLGLCVIALLAAQSLGGYWHHVNFKKLGSRTWISFVHMWLGRCLIYGGMVNAVLGFLLNGSEGAAVGCAVVSLVFASGLEFMSWRHRRRSARKAGGTPRVTSEIEESLELW